MWNRTPRPLWPGHATVGDAVRYIASACDGARRRDGHGYSAEHTQYGHWLASLPDHQWTPSEHNAGLYLVHLYRRQLTQAGFDVEAILQRRRPRRLSRREHRALTAGWAPDPTGVHTWRWWNGARWTTNVDPD